MTKVWNIVSFLAVMNLIALGCFRGLALHVPVAWMQRTSRPDSTDLSCADRSRKVS